MFSLKKLARKGLRHWGRDKMAATLANDILNAIFSMKMFDSQIWYNR